MTSTTENLTVPADQAAARPFIGRQVVVSKYRRFEDEGQPFEGRQGEVVYVDHADANLPWKVRYNNPEGLPLEETWVYAVRPAEQTFAVGDVVRVSATARTSLGGSTYWERPLLGRITDLAGSDDAQVVKIDGGEGPGTQLVGLTYLRKAEPEQQITPAADAAQVASDALQVTAERDRLRADVARLQERLRLHEQWKTTLVEDAHQYADDNDLCEQFDQFMEEHDLPRRTRTYRVRTTVTLTVDVEVEAGGEDDAMSQVDQMDSSDVLSALEGAGRWGVDVDDWSSESAERV